MKQKRMRAAVLLLAAVGMALWLAGCRVSNNTGPSGLSDISYADSEQYTAGAAELSETVEHIDIHWLVGNVTVKPHGSDTVSFSEESAKELTDDARLHYWLDGTVLHIQFCQVGKWLLDEMEKDLTVLVPEGLALAELEVNTLSGALEAELAQPLEEFSGDSTSGAFQVSAQAIENFSASSVSGSVSLSAQSAPKALDIQTTSGNIDLALPEDAAFTLDYDATSGELTADLLYTMESGRYIFGDGTGEYVIGTVSGDVRITAEK